MKQSEFSKSYGVMEMFLSYVNWNTEIILFHSSLRENRASHIILDYQQSLTPKYAKNPAFSDNKIFY